MSQVFEVLAVEKLKDGQSVKGPFTVWKLGLKNGTNEALIAELFCPGGVSPPVVGSEVEGDIEKTDNPSWLDKFRPVRRGGGFGARPEDPKRSAHIARMHAQEMALRYASVRADKELLPENFTLTQLRTVIDWFTADAEQARDAA